MNTNTITFGRLGQFHPTTVMACISLLYVVLWFGIPLILFDQPAFFFDDVVRTLMSGRAWLIFPPSHPPLPNWLAYISLELGGIWGVAMISPILQAACLFMVYLFSRRFVDPHKALLSAALLLGTFYFSTIEVTNLNHNTAQPLFWILMIYLFHSCLRGKGLHYWFLLGVSAAACLLAKYTAVFLLICVPGWLLLDGEARKLLWTPGPWLSLLIFLLLVSPHMYTGYFFLYDNYGSYPTFRRLNVGKNGLVKSLWLYMTKAHQWMFIILALTGFLWKGASSWSKPLSRDEKFLLVFGLLPFVLVLLAGGLIGQGYRLIWFWPFCTLSGLLMMKFFAGRATIKRCHWGIYACIAFLIMAPAVKFVKTSYTGKLRVLKESAFISFQSLADKLDAISAEHIKPELQQSRVIVALQEMPHYPLAGVGFMMAKPWPKIFLRANPYFSPTIDQKALCDATIILSYKTRNDFNRRNKRSNDRYISATEKIISDCVAQGVKPIRFSHIVRYKKPLLKKEPHPPFEVKITLLTKG